MVNRIVGLFQLTIGFTDAQTFSRLETISYKLSSQSKPPSRSKTGRHSLNHRQVVWLQRIWKEFLLKTLEDEEHVWKEQTTKRG